ncbi:MAG: hypothetical protein SWQ30_15930 [Thermodesulfobacteriota bacterium]|nr:hypothetical protein [Thermodesulfobacteriota bacterium]
MTKTNADHDIEVYLKIIQYKRSIGITQWTVLSIFVTVSQAVLILTSREGTATPADVVLRLFGAGIYWFGYLVYNRYRGLNIQVAKYLVELERENGFEFQQRLGEFHKQGVSTSRILFMGGIVYIVFAVLVSVV